MAWRPRQVRPSRTPIEEGEVKGQGLVVVSVLPLCWGASYALIEMGGRSGPWGSPLEAA